jgi:hypothetical protein
MRKIFISYSSKDREKVSHLKNALDSLNKFEVWFDQEAILPGGYYAKDITTAIRDVDIFLLITSENSIGNKPRGIIGSDEVATELALAKNNGALIIPIKLDNFWIDTTSHPEFEYLLSRSQWLDAVYCQNQDDFLDVAKRVDNAVSNGSFKFEYGQVLDEIETLLKKGNFARAKSRLQNNVFPREADDRVLLISVVLTLKTQSIRNFSQKYIDTISQEISEITDPTVKHFSLYLLGVISQFFYRKNAIFDKTIGVENLKQQSLNLETGRLKAKYPMMVEHILPPDNGFALYWM